MRGSLPRDIGRGTWDGTGMSDNTTPALPDRLSADPDSPFFDEAILSRGVGIRFNGQERTTVQEYCISEGWVRVPVGKSLDRRGNPMTMKVNGSVEVWYLTPAAEADAGA